MTAPATAPRAGAGLRRWGKILSAIGGILLLVSLVIGILLAVIGIGGAIDEAEDATLFSGQTTVTLEADETVQLYAPTGATPPTCDVTPADRVGPGTSQDSTISAQGGEWTSFDSFTATADGQYAIACDGADQVLVAPPVSIGGILSGVGGILLGIFGGGLGLLLLVVGLILFFVGRSQAKTAGSGA